MASRQREDQRTRTLLAQECARIMAEEGVRDFLGAKRKAMARLGVGGRAALPTNSEIEQALVAYQTLFRGDEQRSRVRTLRMAAVQAMRFLQRFRPRLVGSVLSGTAGRHSDVNLHLFADTPEEVVLFLMESRVPFETGERRFRVGAGGHASYPVFTFMAGEVSIDLTVFPRESEREAPRSPVDGRPMRRATRAAVQALVEESSEAEPDHGPVVPRQE